MPMEFKDYYATLGLARDASADDVKHAYRKLARKYHPDLNKAADAEAKFKEVGEAYEVLKDPEKRAAYDDVGRRWGDRAEPPPDWSSGYEFRGADSGADLGGFSDFFEALFGRRGAARAQRPTSARGEDHHARVMIDLADAYRGATRSLVLHVPTVGADGQVRLAERTLEVAIPAGMREGQHLRLAGQGAPGFGGAPAGDLYLEIAFAAHRLFRVDGRDVTLDLPVAPWEAVLGASVTAPTPDGSVQLQIPAGSAHVRRLRHKGRGIPGQPPRDLYAVLQIALPPDSTPEQQQAWREVAARYRFDPRAEMGR